MKFMKKVDYIWFILSILIMVVFIGVYQEIRASRNYQLIPDSWIPVVIISGLLLFALGIYEFIQNIKKY